MTIGDRKNFLTGLLYGILGAAFALGSLRYPVGVAARMGPGYFPLGVGIALMLTGLWVLLGSLRGEAEQTISDPWSPKPLVIVLVSVILFGLLLEPFGLLVAATVLIGVSSLAHREFSVRMTLISIVVLLPLMWAIFIELLGLPFALLPRFLTP